MGVSISFPRSEFRGPDFIGIRATANRIRPPSLASATVVHSIRTGSSGAIAFHLNTAGRLYLTGNQWSLGKPKEDLAECFTIWHEVGPRNRCIRVIELQQLPSFSQILHGELAMLFLLCQYTLNTMQWQCVKRDHDLSTNKDCSWIVVIEKHAVLTEVRGFSDPHIDKTRCLKSEAAAILSSAVNLYRFQDAHLRRMFHLIARDLCPIADEVSLVTSALLKDVNTGNVAYRANAIRLLCHITNDASLNKVVKFLYEDLCDDNPTLQIASLVCSINLVKRDPRMAITLDQVYPETSFYDKGKHVQFHAMYLEFVALLLVFFAIGDLHPDSLYSSGIASLLTRDRTRYGAGGIFELIWSCINGKDKMLAIEGFRSLGGVDVGVYIMPGFQLKDSIDVMRRMLRSHKPVVRFSAYRALQKARIVHNVECITPEDHRLMGSSKLYMEEFNHRDDEPEAEHVSQIIKSQSFAVKEASTHHCNLMRRHNV
ncbi:hypothetical protein SASPL_152110 [Salvia splendens]|uniref:Clathrin/coatomer adaptor adaptin-like N-terminal domain-containing protein n=1 Tax=Salvia splendens TaxID=180675 RepID=A0A8X8W2K0_SALSN|nr:hypothetical protein SASPL_152110 [Salvia splendens]